MAEYKIYDNNGSLRYTAKSVKYHSVFMDIDTVVVTVKEASPVPFAIGDYLDFSIGSVITSARFVLRDTPEPKKIARSGSYGEAFQYELVFKGAMWDVKNALFTDIVLNDNFHHFTSLPDVSTYENAFGIIGRIQANLDAIYPDKWIVDYDNQISTEWRDAMNEPKDFALSNGNVLDALNQIYEQWSVPYIHFYDSTVSKDRIRFGTPLVSGKEETSPFSYGKGNGLTSIKSSVSNKDEIKTRITAYGNTTNMPARYYNNIKVAGSDGVEYPLIGLNMYVPNLMIPYSKWGKTTWHKWNIGGQTRFTEKRNPSSGEYVYEYPNIGSKAELWSSGTYVGTVEFPDIRKNYYDKDSAVAKFGTRPKTVYFDGSDDREDIHPSLKGITIKQVRLGVGAGNEYYPSTTVYTDENARVDEIKSAVTVQDDGYTKSEVIEEFTPTEVAETLVVTSDFTKAAASSYCPFLATFRQLYSVVNTKGGTLDISENIYFGEVSYENARIADMKYRIINEEWEFDDDGNPTQLVGIWTAYIGKCTLLTKTYPLSIVSDGVPSGVSVKKGKVYINFSLECTGTPGTIGKVTYQKKAGSITYKIHEGFTDDYFNVKLKQIGFSIKDHLTTSSTASSISPQISLLDGHCGGWTFDIADATYNNTTDDWTLKCKRKTDEALQMAFPNKSFFIKAGDKFVLLNIDMPKMYVTAKEQHLYESMLAENFWEDKFVIEPEIDNIKMASYTSPLRTGMKFVISDIDLFGTGNLAYLIDSISVDIPDADLPKYSVVLRNEKGWNPIEKLQSQNKTAAKVAAKVVQSESRQSVATKSEGGGESGGTTIHSQLSGRDAADSHPMSAITGLSSKFSDYLPLTGGTMTGDLVFKNGKKIDDYLPLTGGTMTGDIVFKNGKKITDYLLLSGGTMTGDIVFKNGKKIDDYLALAGGTMKGSIQMQGNDLKFKGNDSGDIVWSNASDVEKGRISYESLLLFNSDGFKFINGNVGIKTDPNAAYALDILGKANATSMQSDSFGDSTFESGVLGKGMRAWMSEGKSYAEVDNLTVRQSMYVFELTIQQIKYQGGIIIYSAAGMEIVKVEEVKSSGVITAWKCYFDTKSDQRKNEFAVGDFGYCKRWNGELHNPIKYYWRKVIAIGEDYITLSNAADEYDPTIVGGNNVPEVGDSVVQLGHISDTGRQNAKITTVINVGGDTDVPADRYYSGINPPAQSWVLPSPVTTVGRKNDKMGVYTDEGVFTGTVNAKQGLFSGTVEMGATSDTVNAGLSGVNETTISDSIRIWAGKSTSEKANAPFKVYHDGRLYASNAEIEGSIVIKGGLIATVLGVGPDTSHINAGMSGEGSATDSIRFWAGKTAANRASAPFRVQHDGKIYASNAEISGSSLIGGFYLKDGGLTNESTSKDAYITISKTGGYAFAAMGTNVHPSSVGLYGPGRFEVSRSYSSGSSANVALKLSATGATHYDTDQSTLTGNNALYIEKGYVTGLNLHARRIGSSSSAVSYTIKEIDTVIFVVAHAYDTTIIFPKLSSAYDGKLILIKLYYDDDRVLLKPAYGCKLRTYTDITYSSSLRVAIASTVIAIYDATNTTWTLNQAVGWGE